MVALVQPSRIQPLPVEPARRRTPAAERRHLQLVTVPAKSSTLDPVSVLGVVAVMAMVLFVVMVRGVQGAPPANDWDALGAAPVVAAEVAPAVGASPDSLTVTVLEGDTWAAIAERVSPGVDPVEFARATASLNGGYQLEAGQVLALGGR